MDCGIGRFPMNKRQKKKRNKRHANITPMVEGDNCRCQVITTEIGPDPMVVMTMDDLLRLLANGDDK